MCVLHNYFYQSNEDNFIMIISSLLVFRNLVEYIYVKDTQACPGTLNWALLSPVLSSLAHVLILGYPTICDVVWRALTESKKERGKFGDSRSVYLQDITRRMQCFTFLKPHSLTFCTNKFFSITGQNSDRFKIFLCKISHTQGQEFWALEIIKKIIWYRYHKMIWT